MIVGTAGHIDHGKTSLVKALTGVDTDRLAEEKARGITIELGFAYWPRPDGEVVGFIDVPGHERLVHTMLAGATGIDFVVLAIAADDGPMPQTREHLAILDLLGLERGVVAMTKADLADADRRSEVTAHIRATLAGSGLAEAPVLPVSSLDREGLPELAAALDAARARVVRRGADGAFRLAVDRVFTLRGAGTVVTGTVLSGAVRVGDQVTVSPAGLTARVRSLHAQSREAQAAEAGDRAAIALAGPDVSVASIARGAVVLDPALHRPVTRLDARLRLLATERKPLGQWSPVRLHHAASETTARLVMLDGDALAPGASAFVQIVLDRPIAAAAGDRFVLRDISATRTIGGGILVDLSPPERRRRTPARLADLAALAEPDPIVAARTLLAAPGRWLDLAAFARERALPPARLVAGLSDATGLARLDIDDAPVAMSEAGWSAYRSDVLAHVCGHHAAHPDEPGPGEERLRLAIEPRLPAALFRAAVDRLAADGVIVRERAYVRLAGHVARLSAVDEALWEMLAPRLGGAARFRPPRVRDLAREEGVDEAGVRRVLKAVRRRGEVEEMAHDHFFLAATVAEMADIARRLAAEAADGRFAVIAFRDALSNGRKVAIQILEFFDGQGLTMRRGDWRCINPHRRDLWRRR